MARRSATSGGCFHGRNAAKDIVIGTVAIDCSTFLTGKDVVRNRHAVRVGRVGLLSKTIAGVLVF